MYFFNRGLNDLLLEKKNSIESLNESWFEREFHYFLCLDEIKSYDFNVIKHLKLNPLVANFTGQNRSESKNRRDINFLSIVQVLKNLKVPPHQIWRWIGFGLISFLTEIFVFSFDEKYTNYI